MLLPRSLELHACDLDIHPTLLLSLSSSPHLDKTLNGIEYQGWVTKMGYNVRSWRRRYLTLSGGTLKYYTSAPQPGVALRPRGVLQLCYSPRHEAAALTDVSHAPQGRLVLVCACVCVCTCEVT